MAMLYQQVRRPFWLRHPLVTGAAAVLAVWLVWSGAHVLVAAAGIAWLAVVVRRRRRANALRDAGLRARAEYRAPVESHRRSARGLRPLSAGAAGMVPGSAKPLPVALFRRRSVDALVRLRRSGSSAFRCRDDSPAAGCGPACAPAARLQGIRPVARSQPARARGCIRLRLGSSLNARFTRLPKRRCSHSSRADQV